MQGNKGPRERRKEERKAVEIKLLLYLIQVEIHGHLKKPVPKGNLVGQSLKNFGLDLTFKTGVFKCVWSPHLERA